MAKKPNTFSEKKYKFNNMDKSYRGVTHPWLSITFPNECFVKIKELFKDKNTLNACQCDKQSL